MNKKLKIFVLIITLVLSSLTAFGVGNSPNYNGNEIISKYCPWSKEQRLSDSAGGCDYGAQIEVIADGSIHDADIGLWDELPSQRNVPREEGETVYGIE